MPALRSLELPLSARSGDVPTSTILRHICSRTLRHLKLEVSDDAFNLDALASLSNLRSLSLSRPPDQRRNELRKVLDDAQLERMTLGMARLRELVVENEPLVNRRGKAALGEASTSLRCLVTLAANCPLLAELCISVTTSCLCSNPDLCPCHGDIFALPKLREVTLPFFGQSRREGWEAWGCLFARLFPNAENFNIWRISISFGPGWREKSAIPVWTARQERHTD